MTTEAGNRQTPSGCPSPCSIERGMRLLGSKWKGTILWHLKDGPLRFNALCRMISGASKKMIDQRLKEMEAQNLVIRTVINDRPIAVSYELTPLGRTALDFLETLKNWVETHDM
ncbi:winged helix-turn-helix transcriptional regulator [Vibrio quintilis]|uniref:Putative HTH-type transcriptional regulator YybR n=1 Tax=Vibrio quintilis TaxID=1117707 RepID=A0A1M7YZ72_9VIBR|nr:helix-turn-helix domain-containing protein [Vibrio quintilis]SHO57852.1 putative HTH-type transcriptional regulator YybR [Vibrio quintilis]